MPAQRPAAASWRPPGRAGLEGRCRPALQSARRSSCPPGSLACRGRAAQAARVSWLLTGHTGARGSSAPPHPATHTSSQSAWEPPPRLDHGCVTRTASPASSAVTALLRRRCAAPNRSVPPGTACQLPCPTPVPFSSTARWGSRQRVRLGHCSPSAVGSRSPHHASLLTCQAPELVKAHPQAAALLAAAPGQADGAQRGAAQPGAPRQAALELECCGAQDLHTERQAGGQARQRGVAWSLPPCRRGAGTGATSLLSAAARHLASAHVD